MPLTDTAIRKMKPDSKRYRKTDSGGLIIEVTPNNKKIWRYRYQLDGKAAIFTIGDYPAISLLKARELRDAAKALVQQGINPTDHKKAKHLEQQAELEQLEALANRMTFKALFQQWHDNNEESWNYKYALDIRNRVYQHLLPTLGDLPVEDIAPQQVIQALKQMEAKGLGDSIRKVKQYASRIFRYGVGLGLCNYDPVRDIPAGDIFKKTTKKNLAHITKPKELHQLLNAIEYYTGDLSIATALKLASHVFLRPIELASIRWDEVTLEKTKIGETVLHNGLISINSERMKMKRPHIIPLSKQAKALIESMQVFKCQSPYVFPSPRAMNRPINEQSLNAGLHRLGFKGKHTAHGFRHTASTLLNEMGFNRDFIEKQLAHEQDNQIRGTYNKAEYLQGRAQMMQAYSDHLEALKTGAETIPIFKNGA